MSTGQVVTTYAARQVRARVQDRGAAFLLAVYLSALTFLLFGGVMLQRSQTEMRWAEVYRNVHQAFWLAEGALDSAIVESRLGNLAPETLTLNSLIGAAQYTPSLSGATMLDADTQQIVRSIAATGTLSGISSNVTGSLVEEGPLRGIWANRNIIVNGGDRHAAEDIAVHGDLHAGIGSSVSTLKVTNGKTTLNVDGVVKLKDFQGTGCQSAGCYREKVAAWETNTSPELQSVKNGYLALKGVGLGLTSQERVEQGVENYRGVDFVTGAQLKQVEHVDGILSAGMNRGIGLVDEDRCGTDLIIPTDSTLVIDDGWNGGRGDNYRVRDLDGDRNNRITLCVNAVLPKNYDVDPAVWGNVLIANAPPKVEFRNKTTIIVTGSRDVSFSNSRTFASLFRAAGVQTNWRFTVAAELSAVNRYGEVIPGGIEIVQVRNDANYVQNRLPPGLILIKPGEKFFGRVFAPESLVLVRARECAGRPAGCANELLFESIVGDEVVLELDRASLDLNAARKAMGTLENDVSVVGWTN